MGTLIHIDGAAMAELERHLDQPELAAFLLADFDADDFCVVEVRPVARDGYASRSDYHLELPDTARPELIAWALEREMCLIEVHSHGPGYPRFSASDHLGFADWVPHVRWRLRGRPYAALVRSGSEWDGLAWTGAGDQVEPVEAIEITAGEATGASETTGDGGQAMAESEMTSDAARSATHTIQTTQRSIDDV